MKVAHTFNILRKGLSSSLSIGSFIKQIQDSNDGDQNMVGNLKTKRDFLDIKDVISAYWKILLVGKPGEIYNVCRGNSNYIRDLLSYMITKSKKEADITVIKEFIKKFDIPDSFGDKTK